MVSLLTYTVLNTQALFTNFIFVKGKNNATLQFAEHNDAAPCYNKQHYKHIYNAD